MKQIVFISSCIIITFGIAFGISKKNSRLIRQQRYEYTVLSSNYQAITDEYNTHLDFYAIIQNSSIDDDIVIFDTNDNEYPISEVLDKYDVVFRYTNTSCSDCVLEYLKGIKMSSIDRTTLALVTDSSCIMQAKSWTKSLGILTNIYKTKDTDQLSPLDTLGIPYFFTPYGSSPHILSNLHIPNRTRSNISEYFEGIHRFYRKTP